MACPLLWYGRPPDIGNKCLALRCQFRKTGADYLFTICHCHLSRRILSDSFFYSEIMKYATRILACIIAVSKSQEFLLKIRQLFIIFSTMTLPSSLFTSTRRNFFDDDARDSTSTTSRCFFRRRRTL